MDECQKAFEVLKEYLKEVSLLARLETREFLFMYLGVIEIVVSVVLLRKNDQKDQLVYYINEVLQVVEKRCPYAERVALASLAAS